MFKIRISVVSALQPYRRLHRAPFVNEDEHHLDKEGQERYAADCVPAYELPMPPKSFLSVEVL
jgi:hypothetical protein